MPGSDRAAVKQKSTRVLLLTTGPFQVGPDANLCLRAIETAAVRSQRGFDPGYLCALGLGPCETLVVRLLARGLRPYPFVGFDSQCPCAGGQRSPGARRRSSRPQG